MLPFFRRRPKPEATTVAQPDKVKAEDVDMLLGKILGDENSSLEPVPLIQRKIEDFPVFDPNAADAAVKTYDGMNGMDAGAYSSLPLNAALTSWYQTQSFIGHQNCAIIAQHWLVGKACSMPIEDTVRNGWELDFGEVDDKEKVEELMTRVKEIDKRFKTDDVLMEAGKFANVFGIRILIPIIESSDAEYYEKPFNIDGVTEGSFRGWVQIDPMWIFPLLDSVGASDPSSPHFYEPAYWIAGGKRYHRSHLVILRTDEPSDILKPTYMFGGIPLTQRIAERVYAAERTANEAPLLAMSKRTTTLKVDLAKVAAKKVGFVTRLKEWIHYRDNFNVKVLGKDEDMQETDTSLADLDVVIMTQYQIVAAIAKVPSTKLLGTSPKGFNATGEHEMKSYHELLETLQTTWGDSFLDRHYLLLSKSYLDSIVVTHNWKEVDSVGAEAQATIQKTKAETGGMLIDKGVISPDEERQRLRQDKESGYVLADDTEAPGPPTPPEGGEEQLVQEGESEQGKLDLSMDEEEVEEQSVGPDSAAIKAIVEKLLAALSAKRNRGVGAVQPTTQPSTERTVQPTTKPDIWA